MINTISKSINYIFKTIDEIVESPRVQKVARISLPILTLNDDFDKCYIISSSFYRSKNIGTTIGKLWKKGLHTRAIQEAAKVACYIISAGFLLSSQKHRIRNFLIARVALMSIFLIQASEKGSQQGMLGALKGLLHVGSKLGAVTTRSRNWALAHQGVKVGNNLHTAYLYSSLREPQQAETLSHLSVAAYHARNAMALL